MVYIQQKVSSHKIIKSVQLFSDNFKFSPETELNSLSQLLVRRPKEKDSMMQHQCMIVPMFLVKVKKDSSDILCCAEKLQIMQRIINVRINRYMILFNYH